MGRSQENNDCMILKITNVKYKTLPPLELVSFADFSNLGGINTAIR